MLALVRQAQALPLSDRDLERLTHNKLNILAYPQIDGAHSLEELFDGKDAVAMLYQTENKGNHEVFGHWILLLKRPGHDVPTIEFFDSYGLRPDKELDFIQPQYAIRTAQFGQLVALMEADSSPYRIVYNHTQLQNADPSIETCGRWVGWRVKLSSWPLADFVSLMTSGNSLNLTPDELVSMLTLVP